jgi:16S rRNA processing protein RimM
MLVLGRISGVFGVRGWLKIFSETEPRENILTYSPWYLGTSQTAWEVAEGRLHGKSVVARVEGCEDRDCAADLVGRVIAVRRDQLPPSLADEFYWADLEGLNVETLDGVLLGRVGRLFATAANDVLVVEGERERLVPFIWEQVVKDVDLERRRMLVDWDSEF